MPTYQYACTDCGEPLEVVQRFSDDALTECPSCGGHLRKVFSAAAIVFKGSGFYRNDSRKAGDGAKSAPKSDAKKEPAKDSTSSDKDSKPSAKESKSSDKSSSSSSSEKVA